MSNSRKLQIVNNTRFQLDFIKAKAQEGLFQSTIRTAHIPSIGTNYLIVTVLGPFGSVTSSNVSSLECFRTGGKLTLRDTHIISLVTSGLS